jgi:hypothetical protein
MICRRLEVNPADLLDAGRFLALVDGGMQSVSIADVRDASARGAVVVEGARLLPEECAL